MADEVDARLRDLNPRRTEELEGCSCQKRLALPQPGKRNAVRRFLLLHLLILFSQTA